jgi:RHS repeat-associated protein
MMHMPKSIRGFAGATIAAVALIAALCSAQAQTYLPSIKIGTAALISPSAANTYYGSSATSTDGLSALSGMETPVPPEIVALARALKDNPDLIYQYVRNNIQTVWMYGLQKGALGAEIDKSGTAFDQAELMVALLRQAGYTTSYIAGTVVLSPSQFQAWTGITGELAACQLLSSGGIPATIDGTATTACSAFSSSAPISTSVQMAHVWVQVTIPGSACASNLCVFDPAYKPYTWKSGVPFATAMSFSTGTPLSQATSGMNSGTDPGSGTPYVNTLNASALNTQLQTYASNLLSYIQTNNLQGDQIEDIISGGVIVPDNSTLRQTSLPYADPSPPYSPHSWTPPSDVARYNAIPDQYRTTLRTMGLMRQFPPDYPYSGNPYDDTMFNVTFFADEIYGRRLTVDTDFNLAGIGGNPSHYQPNNITLKLDGNGLVNVPTYTATLPTAYDNDTARGLPSHIQLWANHPYSASADGTPTTNGDYMDTPSTLPIDKQVDLITPLTIVHGWGDISSDLFKKWSDEQQSDNALPMLIYPPPCTGGSGDFCPNLYQQPVGDFTREKTAANWLAQFTRAARMNAAIANSVSQVHHLLGFVYGDVTPLIPAYSQNPHDPPEFVEGDSFDRLDIDAGISLTSKVASVQTRRAAIQTLAAAAAALEGTMGAQMADSPDTSSTATRFSWANSPPSDHTAGGQNPAALGPQNFYQYSTSSQAAAAATLAQVDGTTSNASDGSAMWTAPPAIGNGELQQWRTALATTIAAYVNAYPSGSFSVVAPQEAFLGPGQRGGTILPQDTGTPPHPTSYFHNPTKQRGGALVATRYDSNGDPVEIAHILVGLSFAADGSIVITKGGGSGSEPDTQTTYNPATAADVLKSRFVDKSNALGVNLSNGSMSYSSPASLSVGNGDFPYKLSAALSWHPGTPPATYFSPVAPTEPQPGWTHNWLNKLSMSASGMEAMGQSDIRAAVGAIVAFYATQDIYTATNSPQREVAAVLAQAWWANQISGNVVTANVGGNTRQFVQLATGTWIAPGAGYATLTQTGTPRSPYQYICPTMLDRPPYALARGWDYTNSAFTVTNAQGDVETFKYYLNNYYTTDLQKCGQLKGLRLTSWTFPYGMSVTPTYSPTVVGVDNLDALSKIANNISRELDFTTGTDGNMSMITNGLSLGDLRKVSLGSGGPSAIPSMTDPLGKVTTFQYTALQYQSPTLRPIPYVNLSQVFTADNTSEPNIEYDYDATGRVYQVKDAENLQVGDRAPWLFRVADGTRGERDDPLYYPIGNPGDLGYAVVYDTYGHPSRYIDEIGRETDAVIDSRGRPVSYTYPELDCELFTYDDRNNVLNYAKIDKTGGCLNVSGSHRLLVQAAWDPTWNKPTSIKTPLTYQTTFTYYSSGAGASLMHTATRPVDNNPASPFYNVHPVYSFTYDSLGKTMTAVAPFTATQNITAQNTYDPTTENLLTSAIDPSGVNILTSFTYDAQGDVNVTTDPNGNVTESLHDLDRRKTEDHHHDGNISATLNAASKTTYDPIGRDIEDDAGMTFSGSTVTTWQMVKQTAYTPTSKVYTVTDADSRVTTNSYDGADRLITVSDPIARLTHTVYDPAGQQLVELRAWAGSNNNCSVSGSLQECYATFTYGADGEKLSEMDANGAIASTPYATNYAYDGFNRLRTTTFPDSSTEVLSYDKDSNILTRENRASETLTYTYDDLDRMMSKVVPTVGTITGATTNWLYYLNNALNVLSDTRSNSLTDGYDMAGRVTSVTTVIPGISGGLVTGYVLDQNSNRTQLTWPDGYFYTYAYDSLDRMITAEESGTSNVMAYQYDPLSRRTNLNFRAGVATSSYGYTNAGDLLTLDLTTTSGVVPNYTLTYTNAHQLLSEASSQSSYVWEPAAAGTDNYGTANNLNQYPSWTPNGGTSVPFTYDGNGNMTGGTIAGSTWAMAYDPENRLVTACKPSCTTPTVDATYAYDPLGRRNEKSGTGVTTTYFLDDGVDELAEYNSSGAVSMRYIPGPAINEPILSVTGSGTHRFIQTDHHGSVIAVASLGGAETEGPYLYDSYGNCFVGTTPCNTLTTSVPYKYVGMRLDPETGFYFDRARFYSSVIGRFLQTDPVGYTADLNLYTYVGNDPTDMTDPSGEASWEISRRVYQEEMGIKIPVGNHVFVVVADKYGAPPKAQFDYGPDDKSGRLVELHGNPSNFTTKTDTDAYKGLDSTVSVAPINASDANVIAAGDKMDQELGTPGKPGGVNYAMFPDGSHQGNSNSAASAVANNAQQASHPGSPPPSKPSSIFPTPGWNHPFTPGTTGNSSNKHCTVNTGSRIPVCTGG